MDPATEAQPLLGPVVDLEALGAGRDGVVTVGDLMGCPPDETLRHLKRCVRKLGEIKVAVRGAGEADPQLRQPGRPVAAPHTCRCSRSADALAVECTGALRYRHHCLLQDAMALPGVTEDGILTVGMRVPDADWETSWKRHLTKAYKRLPGSEGRSRLQTCPGLLLADFLAAG